MYLDPSFGGMLIQIIVAVVAASGAIIFSMRKKIRKSFSKKKEEKDTAENCAVGNADNPEDDVVDMLSEDD